MQSALRRGEDRLILETRQAYKENKRELRKTITRSKKASWRQLLVDLDTDVYGTDFKLVARALNVTRPSIDMFSEECDHRIAELFPDTPGLLGGWRDAGPLLPS